LGIEAVLTAIGLVRASLRHRARRFPPRGIVAGSDDQRPSGRRPALIEDAATPEAVCHAAHVDADWQAEQWARTRWQRRRAMRGGTTLHEELFSHSP
jgi:hypothetical protein